MKISLSAVLAATLLLASCSGNDNGFTISKGSTLKVSVEQDASPVLGTAFEMFSEDVRTVQEPSVAYRGIFINDEDFGLNPWSWQNYETSEEPGVIGPKTNARIFELLLRLKANLYWPAMHNVSKAFFLVEGNREVAAKYGIYYHASYWGRPHDYLWTGTVSPALMQQQMGYAFDQGIDRMWILNVGDIKPAEYQIELFMDMAWDMEGVRAQGVKGHLEHFLAREFGEKTAQKAADMMMEHYRLSYIHKPEFMGGIPQDRKDTYYQLVQYPVQGAALMNRKLLKAQLARHGKAEWSESDAAFDGIVAMTERYNTEKWKENVLWNQAVREFRMPLSSGKSHKLTFTSLDEGVLLDQILIQRL